MQRLGACAARAVRPRSSASVRHLSSRLPHRVPQPRVLSSPAAEALPPPTENSVNLTWLAATAAACCGIVLVAPYLSSNPGFDQAQDGGHQHRGNQQNSNNTGFDSKAPRGAMQLPSPGAARSLPAPAMEARMVEHTPNTVPDNPKGWVKYADNSVYEGQFQHGKYHGAGKKKWQNGDQYIGEYRNGMKHGHGKYTWANGSVYDGEWCNDQMHGAGRYVDATGSYEGEWHYDSMTGKGLYRWRTGGSYEGDFLDGLRHGMGRYTNGDMRYEGAWRHNAATGNGSFVGTFENGVALWKAETVAPLESLPILEVGGAAAAPRTGKTLVEPESQQQHYPPQQQQQQQHAQN